MKRETLNITFGTWVQINHTSIIEMIGRSSFDFIVIDLEHGNIGLESLEQMIITAENSKLFPIVRVPELNSSFIMKVLDLGARGLIVPQISSREQAEKVVKAAKFPPIGNRGSCPCIRSGNHWVENWSQFSREQNQNVSVIALVEGTEGISNFKEIVKTEGIDAFMIGPFDLSVALGVPGETTHPLVEEALDEIFNLAQKYNKQVIGVDFSIEEEDIKKNLIRWQKRGSKILMTGIDKFFFTKKLTEISSVYNDI